MSRPSELKERLKRLSGFGRQPRAGDRSGDGDGDVNDEVILSGIKKKICVIFLNRIFRCVMVASFLYPV